MEKTHDKTKSLRVLHIASWYPSKVHGSLGNFIQRHVRAIATKHYCEVWYSSPVSEGNPLMGTEEVLDVEGFIERKTYPRATKPGVRAITRSLLTLSPGEDIAMPDIVHLHVAFPAGRAARILAERWGVPLVITEHWTAYHDSQNIPLWRRISMRRTAADAAAFCPVTNQLGSKMRAFKMLNTRGESKYITVPNVVDTELFTPSSQVNSDSLGVKLLHVSSLDEAQKNITGILHSLATLQDSRPDFKFCMKFIGGNNSERLSKLSNYATSLGLCEPCISFVGQLPLEEVAENMRMADGLILFSRKENFPCVIAEAWASGISVITTDVGGIAEHIPEGSERGFLINPDDELALIEAIINLKPRTDSQIEAIRKYAVDNFSVDAVAAEYDKVYREALV
ncbi:MAG: hypothetical protein COA49_09215 [Bacteroidetes bacterium]|nr:MAG: hypothetical protein COA49_09215 [Bacteroidota bacterium]